MNNKVILVVQKKRTMLLLFRLNTQIEKYWNIYAKENFCLLLTAEIYLFKIFIEKYFYFKFKFIFKKIVKRILINKIRQYILIIFCNTYKKIVL